MTLSTSTNTFSYSVTAVPQAFPFPVLFFKNEHLVVTVSRAGVVSTLVLGSDYSVTGAGDDVGGTVTVAAGIQVGDSLIIQRIVPAVQEIDLRNQGEYLAETIEDGFDYQAMLAQQAEFDISRALLVPDYDPVPGRIPPASQRANLLLGFDDLGNPQVVAPSGGSAEDLALDLANRTDPDKGAARIGYKGRTVADRLEVVTSIKDFGAVGDGVADDSDAVQAAVNSGGVIIGEYGETYRITKTIDIIVPVELRNMHILANTAGTFTPGYPKYKAMLHFLGASGVTVEDCIFTADGTFTGYMLNFVDCTDVLISGNTFDVTSAVSSATCINMARQNNRVHVVKNRIKHLASAASDAGGCIWVRNITAVGDVTNKSKGIVVSQNIIEKSSKDEPIWVAGNNGVTEDVIVSENIITVSNTTSAITVFPGKFATGSTTTTVNYCSVFGNVIRGSLSDTAIKVGSADDTDITMAGINVYGNVIQLSAGLFGIRRDTVLLQNSGAHDNVISIPAGGNRGITGFNFQYNNDVTGSFSNPTTTTLPVTNGGVFFGSDGNLYPASLPLTLRFRGTNAGDTFGIKFSGGFVGEDKYAALLARPKFSSANGMRLYQNILGTDVTQASLLNDGATADKFFGPADDNLTKLGLATYRWSTVYAGTGTINTSDAREKQQIRELSAAEHSVAVRLKGMFRAFKFNDAVAQKDGSARIHIGVIAQEVKAAFEAEGLIAEDYAILCHDEWSEIPEERHEDGGLISERVLAGDRYGIRYDELLAFVISAL